MPAPNGPRFRFNHLELTLPRGTLTRQREDIRRFYSEVLGFEALDVPILKQTGLLLRSDPETSQFILLTEHDDPMRSPGYDHVGLLFDSRAEVDALLASCKARRAEDPRVEIKEYEDLRVADTTVHAFYVRFLLPLWLDVQVIESGTPPARSWSFG